MKTIAFCEFEPHAQAILKKHWPDIPIHDDVRTLDGKQYRGAVDVVCGGFPCQDLSQAGDKKGFAGERSSLYSEMLRIIGECLPRYAIFENVTGLLAGESGRWFAQFLYDLAAIGYDAEWHCVSASYIGAAHQRDRVWIIAYPDSERGQGGFKESHKIKQYLQQLNGSVSSLRELSDSNEPPLLRTDDGLPGRMDRGLARSRIKRLGNTVVPQIPEAIGRAIMELEK